MVLTSGSEPPSSRSEFRIGWMCRVESAGLPVRTPSLWMRSFWRSLVRLDWERKKTTPRSETEIVVRTQEGGHGRKNYG